MKIIDVCEKPSGAGCLKQYYEANNIDDYKIIFVWQILTIGDIKYNRMDFLKNEFQFEPDHNWKEELFNNIDNNTKIRIWSSKASSSDYLLLPYLCNLLKDKCNNISVVYSTDYNKEAWSINFLSSREIKPILKYEKDLTKDEINNFSDEWEELVEANSELRILEDGKIVNKKYSDYDNLIINTLKGLGRCKYAVLLSNLLERNAINEIDDSIYFYLVNRLINKNKIKIVKHGDRELLNIIEVSNEE